MICTTLRKIRAYDPCEEGWEKLLRGLHKTAPDDEPLPLLTILDINGLSDTLWAMRSVPEHNKDWRLFAVWCARRSLIYTDDWRAIHAVQIAERYAHGMASRQQLDSARASASAYAYAAAPAYASASTASAYDYARASTYAYDAAYAYAYDAASASAYAYAAAPAYAYAYAAAERSAQEEQFRKIIS